MAAEMAKDAAMVITLDGPALGRETKSLEVFMESISFYSQKASEGVISEPEVFIAEDGSGGMLIIKGRSDALRELTESDEGRRLLTKAHLIVNDLKAHWYYTGDEIQNETSIFAQVSAEMGLS